MSDIFKKVFKSFSSLKILKTTIIISLFINIHCGGGFDILFDGTSKNNQPGNVVLNHISISPNNPSLPLVASLQFKATAHFSDNSTLDITTSASWDSSETAVATINSSGYAQTFFIGTTAITAEYGGKSAKTTLNVNSKVLDHITISPANPSVALGYNQPFTITAHYSDGSRLDVAHSASLVSSNTAVAIINGPGLAKSLSEGTTSITADYDGENATTLLTVTAKTLDHIKITPANPSVPLGIDQQFTATAHYSDSSSHDVTGSTSWDSSNTGIVAVNSTGLAESISKGTTTITADYNGKTADTVLTVTTKVLDHITINPTTPFVSLGFGQQFTSIAHYSDNSTQNVTGSTSWSSSNISVVTINTMGLAQSLSTGTTTITAEYNGQSANTALTIHTKILDHITISPTNPSVPLGIDQQFTATAHYSDSSTQNVTGSTSWTSSDAGVANINTSGLAESLGLGTVTIFADYNGKTANTALTVDATVLDHITINPTNPYVALGIDQQFTATAHYTDGSTQDVTSSTSWTSSNNAIAAINGSGLAETLSEGTATITANYSGETVNTVLNVTTKVINYITISPTTPSIGLGNNQQFTTTAHYTDGSTQDVTSSTSWTSSNTAVATIDTMGVVESHSLGTTTITADYGGETAATVISIISKVLEYITISPTNPFVTEGAGLQLTATAHYSDDSSEDVTVSTLWTSSNISVAAINSFGLADSLSNGTTTITADYNGETASTVLTVHEKILIYISISPTTPSVAMGYNQQFTATAHYNDTTTQDVTGSTSWSSSNPSVATIDPSGLAGTLTEGTATITAGHNGETANTALTVTPKVFDRIRVTPRNRTITLGTDQQFRATAIYSDGSTDNVTLSASWTSSDTSVATIYNSGFLKGLAVSQSLGTTTITADYNGKTQSTLLTVTPVELDYITITPANPSVPEGYNHQFTVTAHFTDGSTVDVTGSTSFTSSNTAVATIDSSGLAVTLTDGTTTITADYNGETATTVLTSEIEVISWPFNLANGPDNAITSVTTDSYDCIIITGYVNGRADFNGDGDTNDGIVESNNYGNSDVFIAKYTSKGTLLWAKRLGGTNGDRGDSVTTDPSDNIIVTGRVNGAADLNGDGDTNDGPVESTGYGMSDIFISKFTSSGTLLWANRMGGSNSDWGESVATDPSGNILFTGEVYRFADLNGDRDTNDGAAEGSYSGTDDIIVAKYSSSGTLLWAKRLGGPESDHAGGITSDSSGNVIVTGAVFDYAYLDGDRTRNRPFESPGSGQGAGDAFISKFNSSGNFLWGKRLGGWSADNARSVTTDTANNIIITGYIQGQDRADLNGDGDMNDGSPETNFGTSGSDAFISKFNSSGSHLWAKRFKGPSNVQGFSVTTDASGNVIVTGYANGAADLNGDGDTNDGTKETTGYGSSDVFVTKFSSSGSYRWSKRFGGSDSDIGLGITADSSGNIVIVGSENGYCSNIFTCYRDGFLLMFTSGGVPLE